MDHEAEDQESIRQVPDSTVLPALLPNPIDHLSHALSSSVNEPSRKRPPICWKQAELPEVCLETSGSEPSFLQPSPVPTIAQSWILHNFHEDQEYMVSPKTEGQRANPCLPSLRQLHTGSGGSGLQSICQRLNISPQNLSHL